MATQLLSKQEELIRAGYEDKGIRPCPKCNKEVHVFESLLGKLVQLNPASDPYRAGWLHLTSCGKDPEKEFQDAYPQEPLAKV